MSYESIFSKCLSSFKVDPIFVDALANLREESITINDSKYDEKIKSGTGEGQSIPLVFFTNGRDYNVYLQTNYRVDF